MAGFVRRAIEEERAPRLLIDASGRILWASRDAERVLQAPLPLSLKAGRLLAAAGESARTFGAFLDNLGDRRGRLFLPGKSAGSWVLLRGWAERHDGERLIFLQCEPSSPLSGVGESGLADDFGLTRSECAVLDHFARLQKPTEIAEQLQITVATVRSHLKQIHTKMAVTTGVQLLRITRAYCDR